MKNKLLIIFLLLFSLGKAQTDDNNVNAFLGLLKSEMSKIPIGKVEEHYNEGYFLTLSKSDYFDENVEIGLTSIYQKCAGKNENEARQEIKAFFEQHKKLKIQKDEMASKMSDFNFVKSNLKIRIYANALKELYEKTGIVKSVYTGFIEVIVIDLPAGIGSLEKKYLDIWKKSEKEVFALAKENTLKSLTQQFQKIDFQNGEEEFYFLTSDDDLFITSSILDLKKTNPPVGKYGTIISIPNNLLIAALPLNDKEKIDPFCLSFMGLTDYMYQGEDTKPISNNLFWLNGSDLLLIDKDYENKKLIYPEQLKKLMDK